MLLTIANAVGKAATTAATVHNPSVAGMAKTFSTVQISIVLKPAENKAVSKDAKARLIEMTSHSVEITALLSVS